VVGDCGGVSRRTISRLELVKRRCRRHGCVCGSVVYRWDDGCMMRSIQAQWSRVYKSRRCSSGVYMSSRTRRRTDAKASRGCACRCSNHVHVKNPQMPAASNNQQYFFCFRTRACFCLDQRTDYGLQNKLICQGLASANSNGGIAEAVCLASYASQRGRSLGEVGCLAMTLRRRL
jgi:hypothetical protein